MEIVQSRNVSLWIIKCVRQCFNINVCAAWFLKSQLHGDILQICMDYHHSYFSWASLSKTAAKSLACFNSRVYFCHFRRYFKKDKRFTGNSDIEQKSMNVSVLLWSNLLPQSNSVMRVDGGWLLIITLLKESSQHRYIAWVYLICCWCPGSEPCDLVGNTLAKSVDMTNWTVDDGAYRMQTHSTVGDGESLIWVITAKQNRALFHSTYYWSGVDLISCLLVWDTMRQMLISITWTMFPSHAIFLLHPPRIFGTEAGAVLDSIFTFVDSLKWCALH